MPVLCQRTEVLYNRCNKYKVYRRGKHLKQCVSSSHKLDRMFISLVVCNNNFLCTTIIILKQLGSFKGVKHKSNQHHSDLERKKMQILSREQCIAWGTQLNRQITGISYLMRQQLFQQAWVCVISQNLFKTACNPARILGSFPCHLKYNWQII